jgi:hypothetical protein
MFESDMLAVSGEWRKAVTGFFAALVSLGLVVVQTYSERYTSLQLPPSTPLICREELRSDEFLFIGIVMAFTALLTLPQRQAQFPGLRDCLALAALPVSAGEVFVAKFGRFCLCFRVRCCSEPAVGHPLCIGIFGLLATEPFGSGNSSTTLPSLRSSKPRQWRRKSRRSTWARP